MLLEPGDQFAGFVVRAPLGHGGSSQVYLAEDPEWSRPVSLKILGPEDSRSPEARARFVHEFDILSALRHPDIVRMYTHGETDGRLWSAHEYVAGATGSTLVRSPRRYPDLRQVLHVLTHVAAGLDFAHANGVVHLDVKPANVLVGTDEPATVKISDFDSARWLDRPEPPLATEGFVVVSVPYAAPELLRADTVSPATDQYALACSAVELLTGHTPFARGNLMATAEAQLNEPPPTLSTRHRWIPPEVDAILHRALAKAPGERYDSCAEPVRLLTETLADVDPRPLAPILNRLKVSVTRSPLLNATLGRLGNRLVLRFRPPFASALEYAPV
ncbi:serine/threonine-protein kinase [Nocardia sp. CDC186]|uniref:non-specific serine/threonine protein kinase n=1 Tax=Nocardia implantans TaxID=3108168 RepID=A0ABU6APE7_9NOCA|nr:MULTISPECIES: serine/threonine-protein kinase [unclassified Nocardia]MBF6189693.1 serine/threonine protein kinase [Nocardia beijingensis]MEA3527077.1 serine/threonine-protein kinase [Nocardia sp. CDC192]MEB3509345.1 serine/threonine-protein kinase [Nocardia sp. CDC186]